MASSQTTRILTDLQNSGIQQDNPSLYETLRGLIIIADGLSNDVQTIISSVSPGGTGILPNDVEGFTVTFNLTNITLSWIPQGAGFSYEIRKGTSWDTASYVTTTLGSSIVLDPLLDGTYHYLIKSQNLIGVYSTDATEVTFTIIPMGTMVLTGNIIDNQVLFFYSPPTSVFLIDHYIFYRNGTPVGIVHGTFTIYVEAASGMYTYGIQAVDIAGNTSAIFTNTLTVPGSTSFEFLSSITDDLSGTKTNCLLQSDDRLLACVHTGRTWAQHFTDNSWSDIQDQLNAGFPIYAEPAQTTGSYEHSAIDFVTTFDAVSINLSFSTNPIAGSVVIQPQIAYSADNITYSSYANGTSIVGTNVRYVKIKLNFTGSDTKSLIEIYNIVITIDVKTDIDSGTVTAVSTDAGGTTVTLNKIFKLLDSITVSPNTTVLDSAAYSFVFTTLNPTTFKVFLYDNTGARATGAVSWKAKGII